MNKYIIFKVIDWGDEFDVPILSIFDTETCDKALDILDNLGSDWSEDFYFGTNEFFNFSAKEIKEMIIESRIILDNELDVLEKYVPSCLGIDIVEQFLEIAPMEEYTPL